MATSGTYNYNPSLGESVLYAYSLCGLRRTALIQEHFADAVTAANMLQARWSGKGVNLWTVDLQTVPLVIGTQVYTVPSNTIAILDAYVTTSANQNRILMPISRSEWATYPNPTQQGAVTVYWFDRLLSPNITLWPVPDATVTSFSYYRTRQIQDAQLRDATQIETPVYFYEAFVLGLAWRLALIWAPDRAQGLKVLADEAYNDAIDQNVETALLYITPQISPYFRP